MAKTIKLKIGLFLLAVIVIASSCSSSKSYSQRKNDRYSSRTYASKSKPTNSTSTKRSRTKNTTAALPVSGRRAALIAEAKRHLGRRYVYGGKTTSGFDCSGFTAYVYQENGMQLSGPSHQQARLGKKKKRQDLRPGDLLFFGSGSKVTHVGMVADNSAGRLKMIHASSSKGVVLEDITHSKYWQQRFLYGRDLLSSEYAAK